MKKFLAIMCCLIVTGGNLFGNIVGFWKTVDEKTGKARSIVAIYPYQNKYYGRLIATINSEGVIDDTMEHPKDRAPGVKGHPYYSGLDFIWNLEPVGARYSHGKILDPEKGKIYDADVWVDPHGNLVVRGEISIFGRNQIWPPATDSDLAAFQKPDLGNMTPHIPEVK